MNSNSIECKKCVNYYVTWDRNFPHGCRLYGVKSMELPYAIVYQSLGKACDNFIAKQSVKK